MNNYLKYIYGRLDRAKKHIQNFNRQTTRFINSKPYEMVTEVNDDGVNKIMKYKLKIRKEMPPNLSFIVGDCIHNLRSILDNIVWGLGSLSGCSRTKLTHLSFPVHKASTDFDSWKQKYHCLPKTAIDIIESCQPFQIYKGKNEPESHPLWILNRLWNDDKHRTPILVVTFLRGTGVIPVNIKKNTPLINEQLVNVFEYNPPRPMQIIAGGICEDGKDVAIIPFRVDEPEPQFNIRISFDIAFDESTPAKGQSTSKCLNNLYDFVFNEVLVPLEPIFTK